MFVCVVRGGGGAGGGGGRRTIVGRGINAAYPLKNNLHAYLE